LGRSFNRTISVPISPVPLSANLLRIDVQTNIAGRTFSQSFPPQPNQTYSFTWDGNDAFGRPLNGMQTAKVDIGCVYPAQYLTPAQLSQSFAQYSGSTGHYAQNITGDATRTQITIHT